MWKGMKPFAFAAAMIYYRSFIDINDIWLVNILKGLHGASFNYPAANIN